MIKSREKQVPVGFWRDEHDFQPALDSEKTPLLEILPQHKFHRFCLQNISSQIARDRAMTHARDDVGAIFLAGLNRP